MAGPDTIAAMDNPSNRAVSTPRSPIRTADGPFPPQAGGPSKRPSSRSVFAGLLAVALLASACSSGAVPSSTTAPVSATTTPLETVTTTSTDPDVTGQTTTTIGRTGNQNVNTGAGSGFIVLDDPVMVPAASATWLNPDDVILGLVTDNGTAQAFPIRQMAYHHIANTTIDGEPYLVTY